MHLDEVIRRVGASALDAFLDQRAWIHRRVEAVTFPARNDPIVRRRVSVDFTIPDGLEASSIEPSAPNNGSEKSGAYFYVPVSVLRKWPPVLRLDLRTGEDEAIPLLTREQNGVADGALLLALAESIAGAGQLASTDVPDLLRTITEEPGDRARDALIKLLPPDPVDDDEVRSALRSDLQFLELAGGLVDNTLLWLRVHGSTGERKLVKIAYDVARELDVSAWDAEAFGILPLQATVETPHIGSTGSYHLAVVSPAPLDIVDASIVLKRRATPLYNVDEGDEVARCSAGLSRELAGPLHTDEPAGVRLHASAEGRQARFYIAGDRDGYFGQLLVSIAVQKQGLLQGAAVAASLVTALLLGYAIAFADIAKHPERFTSVLLLVPGLLAYLVVRPGDHALAREFLAGTRRTLLIVGLLPIVCAVTLAIGESESWVEVVAWAAFGVAALATTALWAGFVLPVGERATPLSRAERESRDANHPQPK